MPFLEDGSDAQPYSSMAGKLDPRLLQALNVMGFQYMTPVQQRVLTELPTFRSDCLVQAKTGTGKTLAFLLPSLHSLLNSQPLPRGQVGILVISPTRELALQIAKECDVRCSLPTLSITTRTNQTTPAGFDFPAWQCVRMSHSLWRNCSWVESSQG